MMFWKWRRVVIETMAKLAQAEGEVVALRSVASKRKHMRIGQLRAQIAALKAERRLLRAEVQRLRSKSPGAGSPPD